MTGATKQDKVLMRVDGGAPWDEINQIETVAQSLSNIVFRAVHAAIVCSSRFWIAHDKPSLVKKTPFIIGELVEIRFAMGSHQQQPVWLQHAVHLTHPGKRQGLGKMSKDGKGIYEIELRAAVGKRWVQPVGGKSSEGEPATAPVDRPWVVVASVDFSIQARPVSNDAAAATAEIQHPAEALEPHAIFCERGDDAGSGKGAALKHPGKRKCAGGEPDQVHRRRRQPVRRASKPERGVVGQVVYAPDGIPDAASRGKQSDRRQCRSDARAQHAIDFLQSIRNSTLSRMTVDVRRRRRLSKALALTDN